MIHNENQNRNPEKRDGQIHEREFNGHENTINAETGDKMAEEAEEVKHADDTIEELKEKENELQLKYDVLSDSYLRLQAEFDNFRKRTLKEKSDLMKTGGERVLLDIIGLTDDFERGLESLHKTQDREAMLAGMDLIYAKFVAFLKQHGITEIETVGQPFDPDSFEAVTTIPAPEESQKGTVLDCIQKGYRLNDKIIRFPKVIVGE